MKPYVHYERPICAWRPDKDRFTTKRHSVPARRQQRLAHFVAGRGRPVAWGPDWVIEDGGPPALPPVSGHPTPGQTI